MWPEIPPVEPFERGIEELTGVRPYKGTLMYYRQLGVHDPYEAAEAPEPYPGQRTSDLIYYLEQSHHDLPPGRHKPSHLLKGQRYATESAADSLRQQSPRREGKGRRRQVRPEQSRELIGPPRPGRATELFQQGRVRADHHVVDESNVCPVPPRSQYKPGPRFTLKKSPWSAACDSFFGDPRDAFEEFRPPTVERLERCPPVVKRHHGPARPKPNRPVAGFVEMDYARAPTRGGRQPQYQQQQQPVKPSSTWKGSMNQPGQSFKRFHAGVVPYETDFNRKATGWQSNYFHEDPTDFIFAQDDRDSWKSPSIGSGGGGGGPPTQYGDYNPRPKSWQTTGQEEEEEPYVPFQQKRSTFEQRDQYHHQQQQQQRYPGHAPGRGSAAQMPRQDYAGPQTWGGSPYESDDL